MRRKIDHRLEVKNMPGSAPRLCPGRLHVSDVRLVGKPAARPWQLKRAPRPMPAGLDKALMAGDIAVGGGRRFTAASRASGS